MYSSTSINKYSPGGITFFCQRFGILFMFIVIIYQNTYSLCHAQIMTEGVSFVFVLDLVQKLWQLKNFKEISKMAAEMTGNEPPYDNISS